MGVKAQRSALAAHCPRRPSLDEGLLSFTRDKPGVGTGWGILLKRREASRVVRTWGK